MLTVLIGPPGCGKSTWAERAGGEHLSTDALRERVTGDVADHARDEAVAAAFDRQVTDALRAGRDVVVENGANGRRLVYRAAAERAGAAARVVVFGDFDAARRRALARDEPAMTVEEWEALAAEARSAGEAVGGEGWDEVLRVP